MSARPFAGRVKTASAVLVEALVSRRKLPAPLRPQYREPIRGGSNKGLRLPHRRCFQHGSLADREQEASAAGTAQTQVTSEVDIRVDESIIHKAFEAWLSGSSRQSSGCESEDSGGRTCGGWCCRSD